MIIGEPVTTVQEAHQRGICSGKTASWRRCHRYLRGKCKSWHAEKCRLKEIIPAAPFKKVSGKEESKAETRLLWWVKMLVMVSRSDSRCVIKIKLIGLHVTERKLKTKDEAKDLYLTAGSFLLNTRKADKTRWSNNSIEMLLCIFYFKDTVLVSC